MKKMLDKDKKEKVKGKKGDVVSSTLAWWIFALVILAVMAIGFFILKEKDAGFIQYIQKLFRFGR